MKQPFLAASVTVNKLIFGCKNQMRYTYWNVYGKPPKKWVKLDRRTWRLNDLENGGTENS